MFTSLTLAVGMAMEREIQPQTLKVMTYNIRFATAPDGENSWQFRREALINLVKKHNPDLLGVQEALASQIDELKAALPDHEVIGVGRDDGIRGGEHSSIFYRRSLLGLREGGTQWISDTPDKAGSLGPGAQLPRIFAWGEFILPNSKKLLVMNCHLDHQSEDARALGGKLMRKFSDARSHLPAIAMGDFNCGWDAQAVKALLSGGKFKNLKPAQGPYGTFTGFDIKETGGEMIDHILVTGEFVDNGAEIDRTSYDGKAPSDHFPVIAVVQLK